MTPGQDRLQGTSAALGATILFSLNGTFAALAFDAGADAVSMTFWRVLLGGVVLVLAIVALRRLRGRLAFDGRRPSRRTWAWMGVGALAVTVQNLGIFGAFGQTSVVVALVVFYIYPVLIGLASAVLGLEHMDRVRGAALVTTFGGCVLVVLGAEGGIGQVVLGGVALAIVAAVAQTVYVLAARHGFGSVPTLETATTIMLGPATLLLVGGLAFGVPGMDPRGLGSDLIGLFVIGTVVGQIVPTLLYLTGVRTIGPIDTAAIALAEPFCAAVIALIVVQQPITPVQLLGGALVAGAALLVQRRGGAPATRAAG